jgi:long-chain acyl-CoA synthetase
VGQVIAGDIDVRISTEGEILIRGPNVTRGYFNRPSATRRSWDREGWFHTGDLGKLDGDGYLYVLGRKKELVILEGGRHVNVESVEQRLRTSRYISHAMVVGEGRPFCSAVVTLDLSEIMTRYFREGETSEEKLFRNEIVRNLIAKEVEKVNAVMQPYEAIRRFVIAPGEFTQENGLLTPTFKMRRQEIERCFMAEIEELYRDLGGVPPERTLPVANS